MCISFLSFFPIRTMANEIFRKRLVVVVLSCFLVTSAARKHADSSSVTSVAHDGRSENASDVSRNDVSANDTSLHTTSNLTSLIRSIDSDMFETIAGDEVITEREVTSLEPFAAASLVKTDISSYVNASSGEANGDTVSPEAVSSADVSTNANTYPLFNLKAEEHDDSPSDPLRPIAMTETFGEPLLTESPFTRVEDLFNDFARQMVALHSALCGNTCGFGFADSRENKVNGCDPCFCDKFCYVYDDCCPDMQLLSVVQSNLPFLTEDVRAESKARDLYTCQASHMRPDKNEADYQNYFSMINYCPRANGSRVNNADLTDEGAGGPPASGSSYAGGSAVGLEGECENREGREHWDYHRPLTSRQGLVYRNKFCAQCHGEHRDNLTDWTTRVTCDSGLLYKASSASEAYSVALNTTGCDVRFLTPSRPNRRQCHYVKGTVISTCNKTGNWRFYEEKVERACASFTSVVHRKYKNLFCYLCNSGPLTYNQLQLYLNWKGSESVDVRRESFFALLDLPSGDHFASSAEEEGNAAATTDSGGEQCDKGMVLDPFVCQCRRVTCAAGFRLEDGNCIEVFASTNYFGVSVPARFLMTSDLPIDASTFQKSLGAMKDVLLKTTVPKTPRLLLVDRITGVASLGCHDDTTLAIDVSVDMYSMLPVSLPEMVHIALTTLRSLPQYIRSLLVNVTVTTPSADASRLLEWPTLIPDTCPTKNTSVVMGMITIPGPKPVGVDNGMSFSPLYNTTLCPRINLTKAEFQNFTSRLQPLGLTEHSVTFDLTYESSSAFYFVCFEDFRLTFPRDACAALTEDNSPRKIMEMDRFEDGWTPEGMTSLICTCTSLVGLLCVMVSYAALPPLREGAGLSTLAMACLLFLAQALHELGLEQSEFHGLCLALSVLIHFSWLSAVFMMTSCTLQIFYSVTFPLQARAELRPRRALCVSLLASFSLAAAIIGLTMLANHVMFDDLGYPAEHVCFIRRSRSRQLGFGLPLGLAVLFNVVLFLITSVSIRRRPQVSSTRRNRVSLTACVRLSVVTGACWLTLFLGALPGTRPWLEYVNAALLGSQGLLLSTSLLFNRRVADLWRHLLARWQKQRADRQQFNSSNGTRTTDIRRKKSSLAPPHALSQQTSSDSRDKGEETRNVGPADDSVCKL